VDDLLSKDLLENDPHTVAKAIIEFKNSLAKRIHTYNILIFDPWDICWRKRKSKA
jgi:hypothetical protein